jgi:cobalt-zinc-cadmium efflux system outer membrane protein
LVRAQNELRNVSARRVAAGLWFPSNPYTSLLIGPRREQQADGTVLGSTQLQVHVEQALEIAGQRWARLDAVRLATAQQHELVEYAHRQMEASVKGLYVECLMTEQRVQVAIGRAEVAQQLLESARTRVRLGAAGDIEINLAQIEIGKVVGERRDIEVEREGRLGELYIATGLAPTTPLTLTSGWLKDAPTHSAPDASLDTLLQRAFDRRTDLNALYIQKRQLQAEASRLRRDVVPNPVLSFDWQRDLVGQEFIGGTVGLPIPLWNHNQGGLAQVSAAEKNRLAEQQLLRTRIAAEVAQTFRSLQLRRSQVEAFARDALPYAERNVELLRRGWQAGKFDLFRVITALREQSEVKVRYLQMVEQLWLAAFALERAVGDPLFTGSPAGGSK